MEVHAPDQINIGIAIFSAYAMQLSELENVKAVCRDRMKLLS